MKPTLKTLSKPRNPFVAASLRRGGAGSHAPRGGAARQQARQTLRLEIARLRTPSP